MCSDPGNYGDLTGWDMLFGTRGYEDAKEQRLPAMLAWRDVHKEHT